MKIKCPSCGKLHKADNVSFGRKLACVCGQKFFLDQSHVVPDDDTDMDATISIPRINLEPEQQVCAGCGRTLSVSMLDEGELYSCPECGAVNRFAHHVGNLETIEEKPVVLEEKPGLPFRFIGKCELLKPLGSGGMGGVYLARHSEMDIPLAVKVVYPNYAQTPGFAELFLEESKAATAINHPNVVSVFAGSKADGQLFAISEHVPGITAAEMLRNSGKLPPKAVVSIAKAVCRALGEAEKHGIIHQNVKPENIIQDTDGVFKLADLGIAKPFMAGDLKWASHTLTPPELPYYIAPEQVLKQDRDIRADFHALGATLYHLACGVPPFAADNQGELFEQILERLPQPPSSLAPWVPKALDNIILKCLAKRPDDRYQSYIELLNDLQQLNISTSTSETAATDKTRTGSAPTDKTKTGPRPHPQLPATLRTASGARHHANLYKDVSPKPRPNHSGAIVVTLVLVVGGGLLWLLLSNHNTKIEAANKAAAAVQPAAPPPPPAAPAIPVPPPGPTPAEAAAVEQLCQAAGKGNNPETIVKLLRDYPSIINLKDRLGFAALHRAALENNLEATRILLKAGAEVDVRQSDSAATALCYAAGENNIEVAALLLEKGADKEAMDKMNRNALTWAKLKNQSDAIRLLESGPPAIPNAATATEAPPAAPANAATVAGLAAVASLEDDIDSAFADDTSDSDAAAPRAMGKELSADDLKDWHKSLFSEVKLNKPSADTSPDSSKLSGKAKPDSPATSEEGDADTAAQDDAEDIMYRLYDSIGESLVRGQLTDAIAACSEAAADAAYVDRKPLLAELVKAIERYQSKDKQVLEYYGSKPGEQISVLKEGKPVTYTIRKIKDGAIFAEMFVGAAKLGAKINLDELSETQVNQALADRSPTLYNLHVGLLTYRGGKPRNSLKYFRKCGELSDCMVKYVQNRVALNFIKSCDPESYKFQQPDIRKATALLDSIVAAKAKLPRGAKYFNGHMYYLFDSEMTWPKARTFCSRTGGHLVKISDSEENTFVASLLKGKDFTVWIGLRRESDDSTTFVWEDSAPLDYANWASNYENQKNTAVIDSDGLWTDVQAFSKHPFVCEWGP